MTGGTKWPGFCDFKYSDECTVPESVVVHSDDDKTLGDCTMPMTRYYRGLIRSRELQLERDLTQARAKAQEWKSAALKAQAENEALRSQIRK